MGMGRAAIAVIIDIMPPVTITPEQTPNPNAVKFNVDRPLHEHDRPLTFYSSDAAEGDALAKAMFEVKHVTGVMISNRFIRVIKSPEGKWRTMKPRLLKLLEKRLADDEAQA